MRKIEVKPLTRVQLFIRGIVAIFVLAFLSNSLGWNYYITEFVGMFVFLYVLFTFHLVAPLTEHLSFSMKDKKTLVIHMVFKSLFKIIKPGLNNRIKLMSIFANEFINAIEILDKNYPDRKYMTKTWIIPDRHRLYLQKNYGFIVKRCFRSLADIISELYVLYRGNRSLIKSLHSLMKHKNYLYKWNKSAAERLLSDLQDPQVRKKLRISSGVFSHLCDEDP